MLERVRGGKHFLGLRDFEGVEEPLPTCVHWCDHVFQQALNGKILTQLPRWLVVPARQGVGCVVVGSAGVTNFFATVCGMATVHLKIAIKEYVYSALQRALYISVDACRS